MAWPFTPYATFVDHNTPLISAAFLNSTQKAVNAAVLIGYERVKYIAHAPDSTVVFSITAPFLIKDATTSEYVAIDAQSETDTGTAGISFTSSAWNYVYCQSNNGVLSYGVTTTAPESTLRYITGDETKRYLFCAYDSSPKRFNAENGRYTWEESRWLTSSGSYLYGATTWQDIDLAAAVVKPPHASRIRVQATLAITSGGGPHQLYVKSGVGDETIGLGNGYARAVWCNSTNDSASQLLTFNVPGNNKLRWQTSAAGPNIVIQLVADGFEE